MSDQQSLRDVLFDLSMRQKWEALMEKYKDSMLAHRFMLTEFVGTAFHVSISSYNSKHPNPIHERCTKEMISSMKKHYSFAEVVRMQNVRGDTPLHLAAAVGWEVICIIIASEDPELISIRNVNGETPLFVAAHCGNLDAFLSLHRIYNDGRDKPDESLCRRKDGNTILHSAISGEYFALAHLIIRDYKNLLTYVNVDGETPLHVLAKKPNLFQSSSHLGLGDSILYQCVFVDYDDDPKKQPRQIRDEHGSSKEKFPENYRTCLNIFFLFWDPIYMSYKVGIPRLRKKESSRSDVEDQPYLEHGVPIYESFLAGYSRSKKHNAVPSDDNGENQGIRLDVPSVRGHPVSAGGAEEEGKYYGSFPPNYTTFLSILKFVMKIILTLLGIGFSRIRKIHEKKVRHTRAMEIMNKMIDSEPSYKYDCNGQRPIQHSGEFDIPDIPPNVEEHDINPSPEANSSIMAASTVKHDKKRKDQNQSDGKNDGVVKVTPILLAAKMGIVEMVKKILIAVPGAIHDQDSQGKNLLMVAAENRQPSVFDFLMRKSLPDYVFHHVDNDGNSILHLAAKLGEKQPWRVPGAALQMQCEVLWYKIVKTAVPPLGFTRQNAKGETPKKIFMQTHEHLVKSGNEWLIKTSESCSIVAALIATVAFATSATVPGGLDQQHGYPILRDRKAFDIFSIASPIALCLSLTALFYFLAIVSWRFGERDFKEDLPRKLLMGLHCLFSGIAAMLLSFGAGNTFVLTEKLKSAAVPIYTAAMIPVIFFAIGQLPLYFDLLWAGYIKMLTLGLRNLDM